MDVETAARGIGLKPERVRKWESGEEQPTIAQLRDLARVYKRPLAIFYLPEPPRDFTPLRDLRRLPGVAKGQLSTKLRFLIRHIREQEEWLVGALQDSGADPLGFVGSVKTSDDVVAAAKVARELMGLRPGENRSWGLRDWIDAVEDVGVFVFQSSDVPVDEMRGFTMTNPLAPVIVVNAKDARSARVFTLFHEFAHILLGEESISNYLPAPGRRATSSEETIEVFCNSLAAEILVPEDDLRQRVRASTRGQSLDSLIESLAKTYSVSREVIARRLTHVQFIDKSIYQRQRRKYQQEFEEAEETKQDKEFRILWAIRVVSRNGRAFTRRVLGAYVEGLLTGRDVSNLLNTKLRHLAKIEALVFSG